MDLNPYLAYRVSTVEIEEAARRAERARMAAENADQIVRRPGLLVRLRTFLNPEPARRATAGDCAPVVHGA